MSTHRFAVTAHTDPMPGECHTPESLGDTIAHVLRGSIPHYVDDVRFLTMDMHTDAGDFHEFSASGLPGEFRSDCQCGEDKDHNVHRVPHAWGGASGSAGDAPCTAPPDCQNERFSVVHNVGRVPYEPSFTPHSHDLEEYHASLTAEFAETTHLEIEESNLGLSVKPGHWVVTDIPDKGKTDFVCMHTFDTSDGTSFIAVEWLPKGQATYLFGVLGKEIRLAGDFEDAMHALAQLTERVLQYGVVSF